MDPDIATIIASQARVEQKIESLCQNIVDLSKVTEKRLDAHAVTISSLEKSRSFGKGRDGIVGTLVAAVLGWISWQLR